MAYTLVTAGGSLYAMTPAGVATSLTLPNNTVISTTRPSRMAAIGKDVVVVNGPNRSLQVDPYRVVRPLQLQAPTEKPTISVATAGLLTAVTGHLIKYTYAIRDPYTGRIMAESGYSPASTITGAYTSKILKVTIVPSTDPQVNLVRTYRTTDGGTTYFFWMDVNVTASTILFGDDMADSALPIAAATSELGAGPGTGPGAYMTLITAWKNRLWTVGSDAIDTLRYSAAGHGYAWPATYGLTVTPAGGDLYGITGMLPRRDVLGVSRRDVIHKVLQNGDNSDGTPNFEIVQEYNGTGVWAPDSVVIDNDIAYFLGEDGIYSWGGDTIRCLSDDAGVRKWFTSATYFNWAYRAQCFAKFNDQYNGYELHLVSAGGSTFDRWIFYDITKGKFYGPHKTAAYTPTCAAALIDSNGASVPAMGTSAGFISIQNSTSFTDWTSAIVLDVISKFHDGETPDIEKLWKNITVVGKAQASPGALIITPTVGELNASASSALTTIDMQRDDNVTAVVGPGRFLKLELTESTNNLGCELYGYEIPFHELGKRTRY